MPERVLDLALRITAEVITNSLIVAARIGEWVVERFDTRNKRYLTMGGSEWYGAEDSDGEYDDEGSIRQCPCGEWLYLHLAEEFDAEYVEWRHAVGSLACDDLARELFEIRWDWRGSIGLYGPAINTKAVELLKADPEEYFRLNLIWRDLPKD